MFSVLAPLRSALWFSSKLVIYQSLTTQPWNCIQVWLLPEGLHVAFIWLCNEKFLIWGQKHFRHPQANWENIERGLEAWLDLGLTTSLNTSEAGSQVVRGSQPSSCLGHQEAKLLQEPTGKATPVSSGFQAQSWQTPTKVEIWKPFPRTQSSHYNVYM